MPLCLASTLALLATLFVRPLQSMIWFATPSALHGDGAGTRSDPWSLAYALSTRSALGAGDTLFLAGGVYEHGVGRRLHCKLATGALAQPIVIRSMPGAWATIDGGAPPAADAGADDGAPSLRISCAHTVWQDLAVTNSNAARLAPTLRKNSCVLWRGCVARRARPHTRTHAGA